MEKINVKIVMKNGISYVTEFISNEVPKNIGEFIGEIIYKDYNESIAVNIACFNLYNNGSVAINLDEISSIEYGGIY